MVDIRRVENRANRLHVLDPQGVRENASEIANSLGGGLESVGIIKRGGEWARVDGTPTIAETVGVDTIEDESAVARLQGRDAIVISLQEEIDSLPTQLSGIESIEENRPATALGVPDLSNENRRVGAFVATFSREEAIPEPFDEQPLHGLGRSRVLDVAAGVFAGGDGSHDVAIGPDDPFGDDQHGVLLDVENLGYALDQRLRLERRLRHEDHVGLTKGRAQGDHPAVTSHHLDDRDPPVAFRGGPNTFDGLGGDINRRRESRRHITDHLVEVELSSRPLGRYVPLGGPLGRLVCPLVGFVEVVQAEVVVDGLGGQNNG